MTQDTVQYKHNWTSVAAAVAAVAAVAAASAAAAAAAAMAALVIEHAPQSTYGLNEEIRIVGSRIEGGK